MLNCLCARNVEAAEGGITENVPAALMMAAVGATPLSNLPNVVFVILLQAGVAQAHPDAVRQSGSAGRLCLCTEMTGIKLKSVIHHIQAIASTLLHCGLLRTLGLSQCALPLPGHPRQRAPTKTSPYTCDVHSRH